MTKNNIKQQINNAKNRLNHLKKRRSYGSEAEEAFNWGPWAGGAIQFISYLDTKIKKEEDTIAKLKR